MQANDIFQDSRVARVRELKTENAKLKSELAATRDALHSLQAHFSLALMASRDAEKAGDIVVVDGWNAALASSREHPSQGRRAVVEWARTRAKSHPESFTWVVFDGDSAGAEASPGMRISYTGGSGNQRADRLICDWLHMRKMAAEAGTVTVVTNDKDFKERAEKYGANVRGCACLRGAIGEISA